MKQVDNFHRWLCEYPGGCPLIATMGQEQGGRLYLYCAKHADLEQCSNCGVVGCHECMNNHSCPPDDDEWGFGNGIAWEMSH